MFLLFMFITFIIATIIQIGYWLFIFSKLAFYKKPTRAKKNPSPVSVIICAKNEAANLHKNLPNILNQNYNNYEVLVVNDNSTDNSLDILTKFQQKYNHLRILNLNNVKKPSLGKKNALKQGILNAKHEIVLLTDADCCPQGKNWVHKMQRSLVQKTKIGLSYAPYYKGHSFSFLNKFIRFETVWTAVQYLSFSLIGKTYMGVGRNLIYKRSLFIQNDGFESHKNIASGDDDLFINEVATKDNVTLILDKETFMPSEPKKTWKSFFRQKQRHLSTGKHYKTEHKLLLGLLSITHFWHYICILTLIILNYNIHFVMMFYFLRLFLIWYLYSKIFKLLGETSLVVYLPILDIAYILYYVIFTPALIRGKSERWT